MLQQTKFSKVIMALALFSLFALLLMSLSFNPSYLPSPLVGQKMPEFSLPALEQTAINEKKLSGRPYLLNVWASWCLACRSEMSTLNELAASETINIIGLNYKDKPEAAAQWLGQWGNPYQYNLLDQAAGLSIELGVTGVPETYLIDADGIIRWKWAGELNEGHALDKLHRALTELHIDWRMT